MTQFWLNGQARDIPDTPCLLLDYLRAQQLTGNKGPCREGDCGACQVLVCDDPQQQPASFRAQTACLLRLQDLAGQHVLTIEGLQQDGNGNKIAVPDRHLNLLQQLLADAGASQCGFCSPGLVIGCVNWLLNGPQLTLAEGENWLNGNLCRCTGYMGQRRALQQMTNTLGETLRRSRNRLQTLVDEGIVPGYILPDYILHRHSAHTLAVTPENTGNGESPTTATALPSGSAAHTHTGAPCMVIGGGTDLYLQQPLATLPAGNQLARSHDAVIRQSRTGLFLNARQPLQTIAAALAQKQLLPAFARFNQLFASLPIRNRATLGGNLAHASPVADSIPFLLVLNATLHTSQRVIPVQDFFTGFKQTALQAGEVIEWIQLPADTNNAIIHFDKVSRRGTTDIATVNCAGCWHVQQQTIVDVRLAMGGASPMPVRLSALEDALRGSDLEKLRAEDFKSRLPELFQQHLQPSLAPISDLRGSAHYRRLLAQQLILAQLDYLLQKPHQTQQQALQQTPRAHPSKPA